MAAKMANTGRRSYRFARRMKKMNVSAIREILKVSERPDIISFAGGMPAPELFPVDAVAQAHAAVFAHEGPESLQYSTTEGWRPLREWISDRMRQKGIDAHPDRVLMTSGSQQGIDLAARIFLEPGDEVIVENPCYLAALQTFSSYEASFIAIDSDDEGINVDQVEEALGNSRPKFIYIVSEFHNPKGTSLSTARRRKLIELSSRHQVPILEDDPYGELRFKGEARPSLAALDRDGMVIYLSTFSKTISPGMRLGWAVSSPEVIQAMVITKQASDLHTSTVEQRAAARLLAEFDYDGHVDMLRREYGARCEAMLDALASEFPAGCSWTRPEGGLFVWIELPASVDGQDLFEEALADKVSFVPGASFFASEPRENFIRLNFSNRPPDMIREGVTRIGKILKKRLI
ncbi:MAG TPA: PLP-dependent aminotransferase family protein [Blastocatellia bacterium]|nr:PLP-dependent aminotransferase family protein [Blastocatellia bacterium]